MLTLLVGYKESFNGTLGEEMLKPEISFTLTEAKVLITASALQCPWR